MKIIFFIVLSASRDSQDCISVTLESHLIIRHDCFYCQLSVKRVFEFICSYFPRAYSELITLLEHDFYSSERTISFGYVSFCHT